MTVGQTFRFAINFKIQITSDVILSDSEESNEILHPFGVQNDIFVVKT